MSRNITLKFWERPSQNLKDKVGIWFPSLTKTISVNYLLFERVWNLLCIKNAIKILNLNKFSKMHDLFQPYWHIFFIFFLFELCKFKFLKDSGSHSHKNHLSQLPLEPRLFQVLNQILVNERTNEWMFAFSPHISGVVEHLKSGWWLAVNFPLPLSENRGWSFLQKMESSEFLERKAEVFEKQNDTLLVLCHQVYVHQVCVTLTREDQRGD